MYILLILHLLVTKIILVVQMLKVHQPDKQLFASIHLSVYVLRPSVYCGHSAWHNPMQSAPHIFVVVHTTSLYNT